MCGIFGVRGPLAGRPDLLATFAHLQHHRGPDGFGEWLGEDRDTYLAHNRLAIIDLSTASSQPFRTADGVLVFNGEIYNYVELRAELEREGVSFSSQGDTEVLANVIAHWGYDGLHRLRGMFAFAYYRHADESLTLGRDRFGIKPLFVAQHGKNIFFSSEIEAIRATGHFTDVDEDARAIYHLLNFLPAPFTFFRGITKVPPGHLVHVSPGSFTLARWYELRPRNHGDLTQLMTRSVAEHMRCDVDYGVFLSGGLDSNIIASLASDVSPGRIRTFSIGFREFPAFDETRWAELAAAHLGSDHHQFDVNASEFADAAATCLAKLARGEPFADASFIPTWLVSQRTRVLSKVALSGDGADEIFGGYRKHRGIRLASWMRHLPAGAQDFLRSVTSRLPEARDSRALELARRFKKFVQGAGRDQHLRQLAWLYTFLPDEVDAFSPGRGHGGEALLLDGLRRLPPLGGAHDEINEALYSDTMVFLAGDMLHKVDIASMDHGLEVRVPFLDHEVVETAFALPGTRKVGLRQGKLELRRRFGARLPPELLRLPKRGFESPLSSLFRASWAGKLSAEAHSLAKLGVSVAYVESMEREHRSARADHSIRMWNLLVLAAWAKAEPVALAAE